jgi:hypothetical protein
MFTNGRFSNAAVGVNGRFLCDARIFPACFLTLLLLISCGTVRRDIMMSYTREEMTSDLDFVLKTIQEVHPNPHAAVSEDELRAARAKAVAALPESGSREALFLAAAPVVSLFEDGHTALILPRESTLVEGLDGKGQFPILVELREGRLRAAASVGKDPVPAGSEILAIDGETTTRLLETMRPYTFGESGSFRDWQLETRFAEICSYLRGFPGRYRIRYETVEGEVRETVVHSVGRSRLKKELSRAGINDDEPFELSFLEDNTVAVLRIGSMEPWEQLSEFLTRSMSEVRKRQASSLIIDLRNNRGGDTRSIAGIIEYIATEPFVYASSIEFRVSPQLREKYESLNAREGEMVRDLRGSGRFPISADRHFSGKTAILVNRGTFSAAAKVATVAADYRFGLLVGETPGGQATGNAIVYNFRLPFTRLPASASSQYHYRPDRSRPELSVLPDLMVVDSLQERLGGNDPILEAAITAIRDDSSHD